MAPKGANWTKEVEMRIAYEVEKRPVLWDATSSLYKRSDLKPLAWEEIAEEVGAPFTVEMISKRFKNMKETFMKNLCKVRESKNKQSGNGADDGFRPTWYLYPHLKYLEKACAQAESTDNLSSQAPTLLKNIVFDETADKWILKSNETALERQIDEEELDFEMDSPMPMTEEPESQQTDQPRPASAPLPSSTKRPRLTSPSNPQETFFNKRGSSKQSAAAAIDNAVKAVEKLASAPLPLITVEEKPSDAFCALVGSRLNSLPEDKRKECENEILRVLLNY